MLLLTTIGRRTGQAHTTPLVYVPDGPSYLVVAAYGGLPWHPAWYLNLEDEPRATVVIDGVAMRVDATTVSGDARDRLWPTMAAGIATLTKSASLAAPRAIPLVRLTPRQGVPR